MKICLSSRQTPEYLQKADEIKIQYRDRNQIYDLIDDYSEKNLILECNSSELDWKEIKKFDTLSKIKNNHLILRLSYIKDIKNAIDNNISSYWGYPITTYYELEGIMDAYGALSCPSYIYIGAPLTHDLDMVTKVAYAGCVPIRLLANVAHTDGLPHMNGVLGSWVRPEDLDFLETQNVDAIEFEDCDQKKEQALYRIYSAKQWPGDLGLIITNLNYTGSNRMIPSETAQKRYGCRQACLTTSNCRLCYRMLDLANPELITKYRDDKIEVDYFI